jgi:hypothetical protein
MKLTKRFLVSNKLDAFVSENARNSEAILVFNIFGLKMSWMMDDKQQAKYTVCK